MKPFRKRLWLTLCGAWLLMIGTGVSVMSNYQATPGSVAKTPDSWPRDSKIVPATNRATLVMFAHPKCPCTRASIEELNRLLAHSPGQIETHIFFLKPKESAETWAQTDLWRSAASIPGVTVHEDLEGNQGKRFGATTSGYVALYNASGKLLFKGGITASRGHAGDNAGASAIVSLSNGQSTNLRQTPVYGCSLVGNCQM